MKYLNYRPPNIMSPVSCNKVLGVSPSGWRDLHVEVVREPKIVDLVELPAVPYVGIVIVRSGQSDFEEREIGGQWNQIAVSPGLIFVTGPMRPSEIRWRGTSSTPLESVLISLDAGFLIQRAEEADLDGARLTILDRSGIADPLLNHLGLALLPVLASGAATERLFADGVASTIAMHLLREHVIIARQRKARTERLSHAAVRRVEQYIHDHLISDLRLQELASVVGLSVFHFARAFKTNTGCTPYQFVTQVRMRRAAELIANTRLSVLEIAHAVGYESQSRFGLQFKRYYGVTPIEFRRS